MTSRIVQTLKLRMRTLGQQFKFNAELAGVMVSGKYFTVIHASYWPLVKTNTLRAVQAATARLQRRSVFWSSALWRRVADSGSPTGTIPAFFRRFSVQLSGLRSANLSKDSVAIW
jgi:hypothetical protein